MHAFDPSPETPAFSMAAVAAPSELAALSGRRVLIEGGNAIEAMIAMAATIGVVFPHMNAIGGDGFWLIRAPNGALHAIDASGYAGAGATDRFYRDAECEAIPARGPLAALTVAGAVAGWEAARQVSLAIGGRTPLRLLLEDAIRHAREGYAVAASEQRYWEREKGGATLAALTAVPGFMEAFSIDGEPPRAGDLRKAPRLADTLDHLAGAGLSDFHRGDIAREIAADLERLGSPVTRDDLRRYEARRMRPLSVRVGDCTVHNLPPPTQGIASLMILGIFDRLGVAGASGVAAHHGLIEAVKRAFAIRDRVVTDPDRVDVDLEALLTPQALAREAAAIVKDRAAPFPLKTDHGDTVWMGAMDAQGWAVSCIQSIYWDYGSGVVLPGTGVHWQNRGMAFSLAPGALNPLAPGRKPFHTLNPAIAAFDDGRVVSYGCMGGDGQPQTQAQILTHYRAGMAPAAAVGAPRWLLGRTWGESSTTLKLEHGFDPDVTRGLRRLGHEVEELDQTRHDTLGHAGMLVKRPRDGRVDASHDPRADGGASLGALGF